MDFAVSASPTKQLGENWVVYYSNNQTVEGKEQHAKESACGLRH
jgi:hypothetical protein